MGWWACGCNAVFCLCWPDVAGKLLVLLVNTCDVVGVYRAVEHWGGDSEVAIRMLLGYVGQRHL